MIASDSEGDIIISDSLFQQLKRIAASKPGDIAKVTEIAGAELHTFKAFLEEYPPVGSEQTAIAAIALAHLEQLDKSKSTLPLNIFSRIPDWSVVVETVTQSPMNRSPTSFEFPALIELLRGLSQVYQYRARLWLTIAVVLFSIYTLYSTSRLLSSGSSNSWKVADVVATCVAIIGIWFVSKMWHDGMGEKAML